jgi:hypothetical protein
MTTDACGGSNFDAVRWSRCPLIMTHETMKFAVLYMGNWGVAVWAFGIPSSKRVKISEFRLEPFNIVSIHRCAAACGSADISIVLEGTKIQHFFFLFGGDDSTLFFLLQLLGERSDSILDNSFLWVGHEARAGSKSDHNVGQTSPTTCNRPPPKSEGPATGTEQSHRMQTDQSSAEQQQPFAEQRGMSNSSLHHHFFRSVRLTWARATLTLKPKYSGRLAFVNQRFTCLLVLIS